jgi:hypothetical protein
MSRDTSQRERSGRRLWLSERCPTCGVQAGARCQSRSKAHRKPPAAPTLHAARGWRQRPCPACKAEPGEGCLTPAGRPAARPHAARLHPASGELRTEEVWRALERMGANGALVRFAGGGGRQGTLENISIQADGGELAGWSGEGESELAGALAAPGMGPLWHLPRPAADHGDTHLEGCRPVADARRQPRERALPRDPSGRDQGRSPSSPRHVARHVAQRERRSQTHSEGAKGAAAPRSCGWAEGHSSRVPPLRPADRRKRPSRSVLLLKALPAGRLTRPAA